MLIAHICCVKRHIDHEKNKKHDVNNLIGYRIFKLMNVLTQPILWWHVFHFWTESVDGIFNRKPHFIILRESGKSSNLRFYFLKVVD